MNLTAVCILLYSLFAMIIDCINQSDCKKLVTSSVNRPIRKQENMLSRDYYVISGFSVLRVSFVMYVLVCVIL